MKNTIIACFLFICTFLKLAGAGEDLMPLALSPAFAQTGAKPSDKSTHPYGGTLVWGVYTPPTIINPVIAQNGISASLLELIFDPLIRVDARGHIVPGLARSWEISPDGLVYTFHLRPGVRFHDGVECTAADVEFTYKQVIAPNNNSPVRSFFASVKDFKALDKHTFAVTLKEPVPSMLFKLRQEIVPKHLLHGQNMRDTEFNYHPVGTGPFKFSSWNQEAGQVELVANPGYFEGRPYLDKIRVETYADNAQLWSALMRHEVDLVGFMDEADYAVIEDDRTFNTYKVAWSIYCAILYNLKDPILADNGVRRAIALAVDRDGLLAAFATGGQESLGPFHPDSPGFNPEVKPIEYAPVRAKVELMHRGWQDTDGDGILEKDGHKLEMRMLVDARIDFFQRLAAVIRQQLAPLGIKVSILLYQSESELTDDYLKKNKPQAWLRFFQGIGLDPNEAVETWYSKTDGFIKLWQYENPEFDQFFKLAQTNTGMEKRFEIYRKIHSVIYAQQPACFLFYPSTLFAISAKFENTDDYFSGHMPVYKIKDWYLAGETGAPAVCNFERP